MGITEVTVPKQYVLVQATEPTGAFEGQLWYDSTNDLTYIFQDDDWQLITLDISQEVLDLATENAQQQIDIIELQANASVTPFDHDTLISDTFSDADGYKDSVNTGNTDATFSTNKYIRTNELGLGANLVAYYKFDETSGTTAFDSLGDYNLTNSNATINQTGIIDKSYEYNGTNSEAYNDDLDPLSTTSVSMWVFFDNASSGVDTMVYSSQSAGSWGGTYIRKLTNDRLRVDVGNGTNSFILSGDSNVLSMNTWYHVVATWSIGQKVILYVNGVKFEGGTNLNSFGSVTGTNIGSDRGIQLWHDGKIDEVGIWNRVLTNDEVTKLYNSGIGLAYSTVELTKTVEIDLPTITGTVTHTELVINGTAETGASITYKLNNGTTDDTEETPNTKNAYNLTGVPTKLKILLNPKETEATNGNPSVTSYCLKLWKA